MYGREFFHESVVKDIVDVITSLKDYDEVQFLTNSASKRSFKSYDDDGRIQTDIKLNCKFRKADIDITINEDSFLVYLILPMTADKEVQKEMAEFLTRINYGLESCNFEIDFSDGEIRCKCFCNCADTVPTNQQISNCILFSTTTVNNYGNGIAKILFGIGTPEEVYLECKKALQEEEETKYESFQDITEEKATCSTTWSSRFLRNTIIGYHK